MNKVLQNSFSLKNTYRVNSILYSIKQVPFLKRLLPDTLYQVRGLKMTANVISVLWEIISTFLGKFLYFLIMIQGASALYKTHPQNHVFIHLLVFLSILGAIFNTHMFNPSRDKYYAMILMRMKARSYTLVNYGYAILKVIIGFLPFAIGFGLSNQIPLWVCVLIPFFVAGLKLTMAGYFLKTYEKTGRITNENSMGMFKWGVMLIFLSLGYGLPALGIVLPFAASVGFMVLCIISGGVSVMKILSFKSYQEMYKQILTDSMNQMNNIKEASTQMSRRAISVNTGITSRKKGFEYLNELFVKRHQKILWRSSINISMVSVFLVFGLLLLFNFVPEIKTNINELLMTYLPYFVFIMYSINRGTGFTKALFINCDHSLLTYSFYKQPEFVLALFKIRLREIIKVNLLPATIIGAGLALLLFVSGGADNPINYGVLFVSIVCMSIFFSVHYLMLYYLLQPYNVKTEMKSATYQIVLSITYLLCFFMMQLKMPTLVFGLMTIVFCIIYSIVSCILVYYLAPKTFRFRT